MVAPDISVISIIFVTTNDNSSIAVKFSPVAYEGELKANKLG